MKMTPTQVMNYKPDLNNFRPMVDVALTVRDIPVLKTLHKLKQVYHDQKIQGRRLRTPK